MNNYFKTQQIRNVLKNRNVLNLFEITSLEDTDCFLLDYNDKGKHIRMLILVNASYDVIIRYIIAENSNPANKEMLLELINRLNDTRKIKYYLTQDNLIVAEKLFTTTDDDFNAELLVEYAIALLKSVEENDYPKVMRILWS